MKYAIRSAARADILRQFRWYAIEKGAAQVAERFFESVQATISELCRQPEIGAPKMLKNSKLGGLRSWPVQGFPDIRIYYLQSRGTVRVVRVLHGKRDIGSLLEGQ